MENKSKYVIGGADYEVCDGFVVKCPSLDEVINVYGEEKYQILISMLVATPQDFMVQLDDAGKDFEKVNPFDFFCENFLSLPIHMYFTFEMPTDEALQSKKSEELQRELVATTSILFGDLDLTKFEKMENIDTEEVGLYHKGLDVFISRSEIIKMVEYLREVNAVPKYKPRNFASEFVKKTIIDYERDKLKRRMRKSKDKESESVIANYLSVLINSPGFSYNYQTVFELKISQFYDALITFNRMKEHNLVMNAIYAGTIDLKKMSDKSALDLFGTEK